MSELIDSGMLCVGAFIVLFVFFAVSRSRRSRRPRGMHYSPAAEKWAASRFPEEQRPVAAYVADLLREQLGVGYAQLEPHTRFVDDLGMDDFEPVEMIMALEEDLSIEIPEEDGESLDTVSGLIQYLHRRLHASGKAE